MPEATRFSAAPTRTRRTSDVLNAAEPLLTPGQELTSPHTRLRYRIRKLLGE